MALQVIGAGAARTGTNSLKLALERLLGGTCHHMYEILRHPEDEVAAWTAAIEGRPVDWDAMMRGYTAIVDWPGALFWSELLACNPDALVLLSLRDPEEWYASCHRTVFEKLREEPGAAWLRSIVALLGDRFCNDFDDRHAMIDAFERQNAEVRRLVPADRLLEWTVTEGWAPICERLELPVPDEEFPVTNSTTEFRELQSMPPLP
jgi:hypothetical protein